MLIPQNCGVKNYMVQKKNQKRNFWAWKYLSRCTGLNLPKNKQISIPKSSQVPISQRFLVWTLWSPRKNEDAETSPFPKLALEILKRIVYNQIRSNQRIFALSDGCHRKLNEIILLRAGYFLAVGDICFRLCIIGLALFR